jgi:hypothetical protein
MTSPDASCGFVRGAETGGPCFSKGSDKALIGRGGATIPRLQNAAGHAHGQSLRCNLRRQKLRGCFERPEGKTRNLWHATDHWPTKSRCRLPATRHLLTMDHRWLTANCRWYIANRSRLTGTQLPDKPERRRWSDEVSHFQRTALPTTKTGRVRTHSSRKRPYE